jgi:hypothetical protein
MHYSQVWEGVGVFRVGEETPEELEDVMPAMREVRLQRDHEARIEPVDAANRDALYWLLGGVAGMSVGLGTAAVIQEESGTGAAVAGLTGLAVGIGGLIGGLIAMPSAEEELAADARRRLFLPTEDDMSAVGRGVDRANAEQRVRCGGLPVTPPGPPRNEPEAPARSPEPPQVAPIELERRHDHEAAPPAEPEPSPAAPAPPQQTPHPGAPEQSFEHVP